MTNYIVTAACVVVADRAKRTHYHYEGAVLRSADCDPDALERLLVRKMIEKTSEPAPEPAVVADGLTDTPPEGGVERPKMSGLKEAWVEYAISRGMSKDEAEAMTRQDLAARFPEN